MTGVELLQVGALVIGVGAPVVSLAVWYGVTNQRVKSIETMLACMQGREDACRTAVDLEVDKLHTRVTRNAEEIARIKGRLNGHLFAGGHDGP
ncbi:MAG: hypothetical protein KQJ78_14845 [Deltaproteobacteria bacterium]|nr:hypothetical protein [Deltaproteobacteria bacterium]